MVLVSFKKKSTEKIVFLNPFYHYKVSVFNLSDLFCDGASRFSSFIKTGIKILD